MQHISYVHEEIRPFQCDICDYSCSQKRELKIHIESVHERKKPFQCDSQISRLRRPLFALREWEGWKLVGRMIFFPAVMYLSSNKLQKTLIVKGQFADDYDD